MTKLAYTYNSYSEEAVIHVYCVDSVKKGVIDTGSGDSIKFRWFIFNGQPCNTCSVDFIPRKELVKALNRLQNLCEKKLSRSLYIAGPVELMQALEGLRALPCVEEDGLAHYELRRIA